MAIFPLFDLSEFTEFRLSPKLFADDQFTSLTKKMTELFKPCHDLLGHSSLFNFPVETSIAVTNLIKLQRDVDELLKPAFSVFQQLQDVLDLSENQRMFSSLIGDVSDCLKDIAQISINPPPICIPTPVTVKSLNVEIKGSSTRVNKVPKRSVRRERPLLSAEPQNPSYKTTDIGYLAILEYVSDECPLIACDDLEL